MSKLEATTKVRTSSRTKLLTIVGVGIQTRVVITTLVDIRTCIGVHAGTQAAGVINIDRSAHFRCIVVQSGAKRWRSVRLELLADLRAGVQLMAGIVPEHIAVGTQRGHRSAAAAVL